MKKKTTLDLASDLCCVARELQHSEHTPTAIRDAFKLLIKANPKLVMFTLYQLAQYYEDEA